MSNNVFVCLWSSAEEGVMGSFQKGMASLETQLAGLKKEFIVLTSDQKALSKHVASLPGQIQGVREDVSFCLWFIPQGGLECYPLCNNTAKYFCWEFGGCSTVFHIFFCLLSTSSRMFVNYHVSKLPHLPFCTHVHSSTHSAHTQLCAHTNTRTHTTFWFCNSFLRFILPYTVSLCIFRNLPRLLSIMSSLYTQRHCGNITKPLLWIAKPSDRQHFACFWWRLFCHHNLSLHKSFQRLESQTSCYSPYWLIEIVGGSAEVELTFSVLFGLATHSYEKSGFIRCWLRSWCLLLPPLGRSSVSHMAQSIPVPAQGGRIRQSVPPTWRARGTTPKAGA